jgi:cysteine desulfurase family protein
MLSFAAGETVFAARQLLAELFGVSDPMRAVMLFNATDALNLAIQGILRPGDHAVTTSMEHNSTARPLFELQKAGRIEVSVASAGPDGKTAPEQIERLITDKTKLVVVNHVSNVFGTVQPIERIGRVCRKSGAAFLVDAAQSAGCININLERDNIDLLACAGHKGLLGPTGTGALVISDSFDYTKIRPLRFGGTGSLSDRVEQPDFLPDIFESGTLNAAGLAGLAEGLKFIAAYPGGAQAIGRRERELAAGFVESAAEAVRGFRTYTGSVETGTVAFNIDGISSAQLAGRLSEQGIMSRAGLHCAPLAHQTMNTFPAGNVRFSLGCFNTEEEIAIAVKALAAVV